jgi:glyoxylase-like metal-dependent hydrolase (beta-lactamase superfamily II)
MIISNVWLLADEQKRRFLIDTGHEIERPTLRLALWRAGVRRPGDLTAVLLTHRHSDHAGNAQWLRNRFRCPIVCHENDAPFLAGDQFPAPLRRGAGRPWEELFCLLEDRVLARSTVDEAVKIGPWCDGFIFFPAYGHTEGSVLIYHEPTMTLFSGDALLSGIPPWRLVEHFYLAVGPFSLDVEQCHRRTLEFLRRPPPIRYLCAGHGPFVHRRTEAKLRRFYQQEQPGDEGF